MQRWVFVLSAFVLSLLLYIDRIAISTAKDGIVGDLGLTDTEFGWVLSSFALGYALLQIPSGVLVDRFGPRRLLTAIVIFWSIFTAVTGHVSGLVAMIACRFLFGAGEAGAYPALARAIYAWVPLKERGIVNGINFSGSRLGAAGALILMPWLIDALGWRHMFTLLGVIGIVWALIWWWWFRDDPRDAGMGEAEYALVNAGRATSPTTGSAPRLSLGDALADRTMWFNCAQYFCSNFTAFFALTWLFPFMKSQYDLSMATAGLLSALPFLGGTVGNWVSGALVDRLYSAGYHDWSRKGPAIIGFALGAVGLFMASDAQTAVEAVGWLTLAVFGIDMVLAPSWSLCVDIGRASSGMVSGTMNFAGNVGSFVTGLAFPYLLAWFGGDHHPFFYVAAGLNALAVLFWLGIRPSRPIAPRAA